MNANVNTLDNGSTFHVVVEDGLMILTEVEDEMYEALANAMEEGIGGA